MLTLQHVGSTIFVTVLFSATAFGQDPSSSSDSNGMGGTIIGVGGIIVAVVSLVVSYTFNQRTLIHQAQQTEIEHIQNQLNGFYGPLKQLLGTSKSLHGILQSRQQDPNEFRTLTSLLSGVTFSSNDQTLIDEIINVTQQIDKLIVDKCGLIDPGLQPWLWEASTHFRLLRLARDKALVGDAEKFEKNVYPRCLNDEVDREIERLTRRREELKQKVLSNGFSFE